MKKINVLTTLSALILTAFMAACADDHATDNDQKQNPEKVGTVFIGTNAIKIADNPATRTSLDYTFGENDFNFFWEPGDFVWNYNSWDMFVTNITKKAKLAKFTSSNQYTDTEIPITFCGPYSAAPYAVIFSDLMQAEPNNTAHLGDGGDCGIGKAKRQPNGVYRFTLEHRSAYLCLLPRTPNGLTSTVITKVTITSDNPIIGYSGLQPDGSLSSPVGGTGQDLTKQVITLGNSGQGFPLNNAQTSQATNAIYSVIYPGTHALKIEYTLKDTQTGVETTVTKTIPSLNYAPNTLTPITANLALPTPPTPEYYMWDAQHDYWWNHLQPDGTPDGNYPQNNTDPRWYNENYPGYMRYDAQTTRFQALPNANEMWWYMMKGKPHWDATNTYVTASGGHLQATAAPGLWLLKKAAIVDYLINTEHYPSTLTWEKMKEGYGEAGTPADPIASPMNYRAVGMSHTVSATAGRPSASEIGNYFFLPALGYYYASGTLTNFGSSGVYWSSSGHPGAGDLGYAFIFDSYGTGNVMVTDNNREAGAQARPFE